MTESARGNRKISAFEYWLRTGRRAPVEYKFNGWHDPGDGRFTEVGSGRYFPPGGSVAPDRQSKPSPTKTRTGVASGRRMTAPRSVAAPLPYLSSVHNDIRQVASGYRTEAGTEDWTIPKAFRYLLGQEDIFAFKAQWVRGNRQAIVAAAKRYDLPVQLLAGVTHIEVGGDAFEADSLGYSARTDAGRNLPPPFERANRPRDETSFGNVSVQVRRASESLGYGDSASLTESQRRVIISSLKDPSTNIFIAAKHLADLRDIDFKGTPSDRLTRAQIEAIATRYNRGPNLPLAQIRQNLEYGKKVTKRWRLLGSLVK